MNWKKDDTVTGFYLGFDVWRNHPISLHIIYFISEIEKVCESLPPLFFLASLSDFIQRSCFLDLLQESKEELNLNYHYV